MSCPEEVVHDLDGPVVGALQPLHLPTAKLLQLGTSEMRIVNLVDFELGLWVSKVQFTAQAIVLINEPSTLCVQVKLTTIYDNNDV